jgi:hypothetical protein
VKRLREEDSPEPTDSRKRSAEAPRSS